MIGNLAKSIAKDAQRRCRSRTIQSAMLKTATEVDGCHGGGRGAMVVAGVISWVLLVS